MEEMIASCITFWINEEEGIDEKVAGQKLFSIAFRCASNQAGALFRLLCKKIIQNAIFINCLAIKCDKMKVDGGI